MKEKETKFLTALLNKEGIVVTCVGACVSTCETFHDDMCKLLDQYKRNSIPKPKFTAEDIPFEVSPHSETIVIQPKEGGESTLIFKAVRLEHESEYYCVFIDEYDVPEEDEEEYEDEEDYEEEEDDEETFEPYVWVIPANEEIDSNITNFTQFLIVKA